MNVNSLMLQLIIFELGTMVVELVQNFFKFLINFYEGITEAEFQGKKHYFLIWDLSMTLLLLAFQILCLVKFSFQYNLPVFWSRDLITSILSSLKLITDYLKSFRMVRKIKK